ncbi:GNAT family N-acetyltransferase [Pedobacter mucosus]|uniref:GNAT family N-acetyltransferase n=1 Tax=Pedobacter mucosus TaxID=2895286 RepID=UPI001EE4E3DE|nr:GNAT family N-acetyltransferase [Pedobacter mucosus]UKT63975.1 GNAT family N-acetyltransferase [Pedobacter mucosus]
MIETERLILKPLKHNQLQKYIEDDSSLEKEFGLIPSKRSITPNLQKALAQSTLPNVHDQDSEYMFNTLWIIISKADNKIVGDLSFVGKPDQEGEIEIGYGTYEEFRGKGFMIEAVARIIQWAREQPKVKSIYATTVQDNMANYSILQKNNFVQFGEGEGMFTWKLIL